MQLVKLVWYAFKINYSEKRNLERITLCIRTQKFVKVSLLKKKLNLINRVSFFFFLIRRCNDIGEAIYYSVDVHKKHKVLDLFLVIFKFFNHSFNII